MSRAATLTGLGAVVVVAFGLAWVVRRGPTADLPDEDRSTTVSSGHDAAAPRLAGSARADEPANAANAANAAEVADLVALLSERRDADRRERTERAVAGRGRLSTNATGLEGPVAALRAIGPAAVEALAEALASDDESLRIRAADALATFGEEAAPAIPHLRRAATNADDSPYVRAAAVRTLGALGARARKAGPDLAAWALDDETPEVLAIAVAGAIWPVLGDSPQGREACGAVLRRQALEPCRALFTAMAEYADHDGFLRSELVAMLESDNEGGDLEGQALAILGRVARDDGAANRVLAERVEDEDRGGAVRSSAAYALARSGPNGRARLVEIASRGEPHVRRTAFDALCADQRGPDPAATRLLVAALAEVEDAPLHDLLTSLAPYARGEHLAPVVAAIARFAQPGPPARRPRPRLPLAAQHLARVPESAAEACRLAIRLLGDAHPDARRYAAEALVVQAAAARDEAVPALRRALEDENPEVVTAAARALERFRAR
jgi:HEAT repeat protein